MTDPEFTEPVPPADAFDPAARDALSRIFAAGTEDERSTADPVAARAAARAVRPKRDETAAIVRKAGRSAAAAVRAKGKKRSDEEKPGAA